MLRSSSYSGTVDRISFTELRMHVDESEDDDALKYLVFGYATESVKRKPASKPVSRGFDLTESVPRQACMQHS